MDLMKGIFCRHAWTPWKHATFRDLSYGFARTFGNTVSERHCPNCGKVQRQTGYRP